MTSSSIHTSLVRSLGACILVSASLAARPLQAGAILPAHKTQVIIEGRFADPQPEFLLVFSVFPWLDAQRQPLASFPAASISKFPHHKDQAAVRVGGKSATSAGFEYNFGSNADGDMPWNNGKTFNWTTWDRLPSDIWDNLSVISLPSASGKSEGVIEHVTVRRNGQLLFDSKAAASYPNKRPIKAAFAPFQTSPKGGQLPVLNLALPMARFRNDYYELEGNPILTAAYSDLGQTDKRKYAQRGENWCSEFASYVYRLNRIRTPDPDAADVQFQNMHEFFERDGEVYSQRDVAGWTDEKKIATILPGSFVSILIGQSTHSLFFTGWVRGNGNGGSITHYAALSGNNSGMVWSHSPLALPNPNDLKGMPKSSLADFDQKVFFGVPKVKKAR